MKEQNRRRFARFNATMAVLVTSRRDRSFAVDATGIDISEGGMGVLSPRALAIDEEFDFLIRTIHDFPFRGIVRRCDANSAGTFFSVGVEFVRVLTIQSRALEQELTRLRAISKR